MMALNSLRQNSPFLTLSSNLELNDTTSWNITSGILIVNHWDAIVLFGPALLLVESDPK